MLIVRYINLNSKSAIMYSHLLLINSWEMMNLLIVRYIACHYAQSMEKKFDLTS